MASLEDVMGHNAKSNYLGIHFRFNPGDFFHSGFITEGSRGYMGLPIKLVNSLKRSLQQPEFFMRRALSFTQKQLYKRNRSLNPFNITSVYLASPRNIAKRFDKLDDYTIGNQTFKIFTNQDTWSFLKEKSEDCPILEQYFGEILSTFEKEILVRSRIFYRARPSNWSFNVQGHRFARYEYEYIRYDNVIFSVFES